MKFKNKLDSWLLNKIQRKIGLFFSLLMIIILFFAVYIYFRTSTNHFRQNIRRRLHDIVSISALEIDSELHKTLIDSSQQDNETYTRLKKSLQSIRDATSDIYFIYTMRYDDEKGLVFVVDAEENEAELAKLGDIYEAPSDILMMNAANMNEPIVEKDFYTDEWGTWLTGYAPFFDKNGNREGILGIDIKADTVKQYEKQLMVVAVLMMIVAFPTVFFLGWYFGREIAKPIVRIANTSSRIANGDLSLKVIENSPDEIGLLAKSFNKMTLQLKELISNLEEKVKERTTELSNEIEERKRAEQRLIRSERNYNAILHDPSTFIGTIKPDGTLITANRSALNFIEKRLEDVKDQKFWDTPWWNHSDELQGKLKQSIIKAANGEQIHFEANHQGAEGRIIFVDFSVRPVKDEVGNIISLIVEGLDVTKLKNAEKKVQKLLDEKEILLKEVHHRIKNNMATIESILKIHSREIADLAAQKALKDASGRVRSMRVLYDKLYRAGNFKEINMKKYLEPFIDEIIQIFPNYKEIHIHKEIDNFKLGTKVVFPLGIILNELLTNSMKYAFREKQNKKIFVSVKLIDDKVNIILQDNGIGLPENFNWKESKGFGFHLIRMLIEQIKGSLQIEQIDGTRFVIDFEKNENNN